MLNLAKNEGFWNRDGIDILIKITLQRQMSCSFDDFFEGFSFINFILHFRFCIALALIPDEEEDAVDVSFSIGFTSFSAEITLLTAPFDLLLFCIYLLVVIKLENYLITKMLLILLKMSLIFRELLKI